MTLHTIARHPGAGAPGLFILPYKRLSSTMSLYFDSLRFIRYVFRAIITTRRMIRYTGFTGRYNPITRISTPIAVCAKMFFQSFKYVHINSLDFFIAVLGILVCVKGNNSTKGESPEKRVATPVHTLFSGQSVSMLSRYCKNYTPFQKDSTWTRASISSVQESSVSKCRRWCSNSS